MSDTPAREDAWVRHRPPASTGGAGAVTPEPPGFDDHALVRRIMAAYRFATGAHAPDASGWSVSMVSLKADAHAALLGEDVAAAADLLRHPTGSLLYYGFDELCREDEAMRHGITHVITRADWLYDLLRRLAEAVGVERLEYPELLPGEPPRVPEVETLLDQLDEAFGFRIDFPNPFGGERGLRTSRGVAGFRAIQSLYQAWRIQRLLPATGGGSRRILEIGGGAGRTCYYASRFGFDRYDLVDIPLTGAAQANLLGRALGAEALSLPGEDDAAPVRLMLPQAFLSSDDRYDLIFNVDGLTEMARDSAEAYWSAAKARAPRFLSINHEVNAFTFRELYTADGTPGVERHPYWLRRGYVDELATFG